MEQIHIGYHKFYISKDREIYFEGQCKIVERVQASVI